MKNLFFNKGNRTIYKGDAESASPITGAKMLPTETKAKAIDREDVKIKHLERQAKTDVMTRFYMYGF